MMPRGKLEAKFLEEKDLLNMMNNYDNIRKLSPPRLGTIAAKWDGTIAIGKLLAHILWLEKQQIGKIA